MYAIQTSIDADKATRSAAHAANKNPLLRKRYETEAGAQMVLDDLKPELLHPEIYKIYKVVGAPSFRIL
jgi:hypothetical protein